MKKDLVAVILAGGEGKRFWPFSTDKNLFSFFGKPLVAYTVYQQLPTSVTRVVSVVNEVNQQAIQSIPLDIPHQIVVQGAARGMADALLCAEAYIKDSQILILIADDLADRDLFEHIIAFGQQRNSFAVLPGWKTEKYFHGGYLVLEGDRIKNIVEKPGEGRQPSQYVYSTGQFITDSAKIFEEMKQINSDTDDVYERALSALMAKQEFHMLPYEGFFASMKYPWNPLVILDNLLHTHLHEYRGKNVEVKSNVAIEGPVYIEDDVRIFENTKIVGPCYIGRGTIIGNNNIIRDSHIGAGCVTGFNTDITRSYVGDNCWFHSNYIGDSVLEGNISMGSGSVLANLRLDEGEIFSVVKGERVNTKRHKLGAMIGKNVRIGVNTSIMPGVKIGSNSFIGAGITIDRDVAAESFCFQKGNYTTVKNMKQTASDQRDAFKKRL